MRIIGFSHGVLHEIINPYSRENIELLKNCGSNAIEIHCHFAREAELLGGILPFLHGFDYISIHCPCDIRYGNNTETKLLLEKLTAFYRSAGAQLMVVHPDRVDDWNVFADFKVNWAAENMDDRKQGFKDVASMSALLRSLPDWGLVLDVGHCKVNDKTMKLAYDFVAEFRDRIREIHLSGYETIHDPLYRTKQVEIIEACRQLEVPIIIESEFKIFDGQEGAKKEYDYILKNLNLAF